MELDELREYCLNKPAVTEGEPFGPGVLVFKVLDKLFALCSMEEVPLTVNLKCDPERAIELREQYADIVPGYHMNKKHWNTVNVQGDLPYRFVQELIDHSYELVVSGLPKTARQELLKNIA
jgi:predicted DNA-binding protein (MmcQ/YjbR family)